MITVYMAQDISFWNIGLRRFWWNMSDTLMGLVTFTHLLKVQEYCWKYTLPWSTHETTSSIWVTPGATTTYSVTVDDGIGSCTDDIEITVNNPQIDLGAGENICLGDSVLLDAGAGFDQYVWSTGDSTQTIYATSPGTYTATVGLETPVQNEYSMSFDGIEGAQSYIEGPNITNQPEVLSVSAWVKLDSLINYQDNQTNIVHQAVNGQWSMAYDQLLQQFLFGVKIGTTWYKAFGNASASQWFYITGVYDRIGGSVKLYINGQLSDELNGVPNTDLNTFTYPFAIGGSPGTLKSIDGNIDNVEVWNAILSQSQIQQYMNCPPTGNEAGLVGYWNFEEGNANYGADLTPNGNDGTSMVHYTAQIHPSKFVYRVRLHLML